MIMKEMVKYVVDAGSYAPIAILIEERADSVRISYERMASYLRRLQTVMLSRWRERLMKRLKTF